MEVDRVTFEILRTINFRGGVSPLIEKGYTYNQIALILNDLIDSNYVIIHNDILELTESGRNLFNNYKYQYGFQKEEKWLGKLENYMINQISIDDLYLPKDIRNLKRRRKAR